MSDTYVALLRGINLGGKNKLPMKDLVDMFGTAGCRDVQSYIQSGNVIFKADSSFSATIAGIVTAQIAERFGYRVPVILRTTAQLGAVIHHNPFIAAGAALDALHVMFLADQPSALACEHLDPERSSPDAFKVLGREIYLHLPAGVAHTKLTNAYFDAKLATVSTGRNWRTVTTLFELMES
jgi:uncharacterized protein (DUF1697 family)